MNRPLFWIFVTFLAVQLTACSGCSDETVDAETDVSLDDATSSSSSDTDRWHWVHPGSSIWTYFDLHVVSADEVWLVGWADPDGSGDIGVALHTEDGGQSWREVDLPTDDKLVAVTFHGDHGFILYRDNQTGLFTTDDGGDSWEQREIPFDDRLSQMSFLDDSTGWVGGDGILRTDDGGQSWTEQIVGGGAGDEFEGVVGDIHFVDESTGTAVTQGGQSILHTTDGGDSWNVAASDLPGRPHYVEFVDHQHGWVGLSNGELLTSDDGGQSWEREAPLDDNINGISFVDTEKGWIAGAGAVHLTTDGGQSWELEQSLHHPEPDDDRAVELRGIEFADDETGWLIGVALRNTEREAPVFRYE